MSKTPSARTILRYIKNHPGKKRSELSNEIFSCNLRLAVDCLRELDNYLIKQDSSAGKYRDTTTELWGEPCYFINPVGVDYLNDHFSIEFKFWVTVIISVFALLVSFLSFMRG